MSKVRYDQPKASCSECTQPSVVVIEIGNPNTYGLRCLVRLCERHRHDLVGNLMPGNWRKGRKS